MTPGESGLIGFACAYTPLALIDAAGFVPYRVLPLGDFPEQAGSLLHENVCPYVKKILDRAMAGDIPELAGMVFMNSCDTMRRLADAWSISRPDDRIIVVDLPATQDEGSVHYFSQEIRRLAEVLPGWGGCEMTDGKIENSITRYRDLSAAFELLGERVRCGKFPGGWKTLQEIYNQSLTSPVEKTLAHIKRLLGEPEPAVKEEEGVPVYLMGNVLPDPEALAMIEACGAHIVADDLCTGSRMHAPMDPDGAEDVFLGLAQSLLYRQPCARTFDADEPLGIARETAERAKAADARGVIAHVMKFCDPYLARIPYIKEAFREAGIPLLVLEGDCTLRSLGQFSTRIQAFIEMLR